MYFTKAVELLGASSFPPFRVAFKARDASQKVVDMEFIQRKGQNQDRQCNTVGIVLILIVIVRDGDHMIHGHVMEEHHWLL